MLGHPMRSFATPARLAAVALVSAVVGGVAAWQSWNARPPAAPPASPPSEVSQGPIRHEGPKWLDGIDPGTRRIMRDMGGYGDWALVAPQSRGIDARTRAQLEALGYADGVAPAPAKVNVLRYDESRSWNGTNLYVAGHGPEATLIDMQGRTLHRWYFPMLRSSVKPPDLFPMRRAHAFPNGDLLALYDMNALVKMDRDSKFLWAYANPIPHHDFVVTPGDEVYLLTAEHRKIPAVDAKRVVDNFIVRLDADGREIQRVSILDALLASGWPEVGDWLRRAAIRTGSDVLHTNSLQVLDGRLADRLSAFAAGRVLLSCLTLHALFVIDLESGKAVWKLRGRFRYQHDARLLETGRLLLFDNRRGRAQRSYVHELDPTSGVEEWTYGREANQQIYSWCCGMARRLPNGNTLIVESQAGRAIEVTPTQEIVWEFVHPHRAGPKDELIAQLFDVVRLAPDFGRAWLPAIPGG
jgi:hypothetical protein